MKAAYKELSEILAEQEDLTKKTREVPKEKFAQQSNKLQLDQHNLRRDLAKSARNTPDAAAPEVRKPIDEAGKHMEQAAKAVERDRQADGVKQQEKAEESLKQARRSSRS